MSWATPIRKNALEVPIAEKVDMLMEANKAALDNGADFVNSTAAARVNGYVGGNATLAELQTALEELGLPAEVREELLEKVNSGLR